MHGLQAEKKKLHVQVEGKVAAREEDADVTWHAYRVGQKVCTLYYVLSRVINGFFKKKKFVHNYRIKRRNIVLVSAIRIGYSLWVARAAEHEDGSVDRRIVRTEELPLILQNICGVSTPQCT